jgi:acetyltransferase-like isoleucine patch superfamily enzyme
MLGRSLSNQVERLCQWRRAVLARLAGNAVARGARLHSGVSLRPGFARGTHGRIRIDESVTLDENVCLHAWGGRIKIGARTFVGPASVIYGHGEVDIGADCLIAMHCRILSSEHTIDSLEIPINAQPDQLRPTRIGNDVWLGAGVTVLGGVTIGDHCVVGAGAVVTKDLAPGSIAMGVPARVVRQRSST